jgi:X-Pro dipeptidyl-peptidase
VDDASVPGAQLASAEKSIHRLIYATKPLSKAVHLSGTARIKLRVASNKPAANLSVWLVSLPWTDSRNINDNIITRGWADPQNHASLTGPCVFEEGDEGSRYYVSSEGGQPLTPGEAVTLSFDLEPDDQIIPKGARIGLMVFSSDRDFTLWPEPGTELTVDLTASHLHLPVVGGYSALSRAIK